jgi:hypothetical protein
LHIIINNLLFFAIAGHPRNKTASGGPGDSIEAYALSLASDRTSTFARNVENFISCTKESRESTPQVVMRNMRQFMSGMKNYLVKHGEGDFAREVQLARSKLKSDEFLNLDTILESVMHRLIVLPLREHLYAMFVDYYTRSNDIQLLVENVKYAANRTPTDFGIRVRRSLYKIIFICTYFPFFFYFCYFRPQLPHQKPHHFARYRSYYLSYKKLSYPLKS